MSLIVLTALAKSEKKPFLITKLSGLPVGDYEAVKARVVAMLTKLGVDRADLCLIHWPGLCSWDPTGRYYSAILCYAMHPPMT